MDVPHSRPAVRVGVLGPSEVVAAIQSALGLAMPGSFLAENRLFVLQPVSGESPESPIDAVLLVVTAEDGVTEEVREQLRISHDSAPVPVVAFLDGCDRVPAGQAFVLDLIELDLRSLAADLGLAGDDLAVVRGSSHPPQEADPAWSAPIHALVAALAAQIAHEGGDFRMSIADLVPTRRGTVVLGHIETGRVRAGQELEVSSSGRARTGRIRGVMRGWDLVPDAQAGEDVGLFLEKLRMTDFLGAQTLTRTAQTPQTPRASTVSPELKPGGPGTFVIPVFYATDRNQTAELTPRLVYGAGRGDLTFGVAEVSLPRSRRLSARPAPPWWRLESDEHLANHVVLLDVSVHDREAYVDALRRTIVRAARPDVLIYVHGYNVTFEDAARRTAQLANDLDLLGVPILYSWPSEGRAHLYTVDELNVEWALPHFEELLRLVLAESGARTVHVVAEGMGNRALVRALGAFDALAPEAAEGGAHLRQVVFVAPDVDRDTFLGFVPRFAGRAERFTLYGSSRDRGLQASRIVHSRPRAGESGETMARSGSIDAVDTAGATDAASGTGLLDLSHPVLKDLAALLQQGLPPEQRSGLVSKEQPDGPSWQLQR